MRAVIRRQFYKHFTDTPYTMRNLFFCVCLTALLFAACGGDETSRYDGELLGTWSMDSGSGTGQITTKSGNDVVFTSEFTGLVVEPIDYQIIFSPDNTYSAMGNLNMKMTYDMMGQTMTQSIPMNGVLSGGTFEVTGNVMRVSNDQGETLDVTIVSLDEDKLTLEAEAVVTRSAGGYTTDTDQIVTYTFVRVN